MNSAAKHIAIIMDGNGRWASARGRSRFVGHIKGAKAAKSIIEHCAQHPTVEHLTLFAFSTENWFRPQEEVSFLMKLLLKQLERERATLIENNICFKAIGDLSRLPKPVQLSIQKSIEETKSNSGLILTFALSYSGKQDLVSAMKLIAEKIQAGELLAKDINEEIVSQSLPSSFLPNPDLIIRTSGEHRLSNFFLWQSAYSELYIVDKMWPEFSSKDFDQALACFKNRQRRFGRTGEQLQQKTMQPSPKIHPDNLL